MSKQLSVRDMQANEVVMDIARLLNIDYHEDNNEICIDIPKKMGSGYIKAISFDHGLGVLEVDCRLNETVELQLDNGLVQPLKMIFNRESTLGHRFESLEDKHDINIFESSILSCNRKHGHIFRIPRNEPVCAISLEINRKLFEKKIESFLTDMNEHLEELFRDVNGINLFYYKGYYSLEIAKFLQEFTECDLSGFMRSVYLEGKAYEILTHQLKQYLDDQNDPESRKILRQSTVDKIQQASEIIKNELDNVPNILTLSHRIGLNPHTMQNGFNVLYKMSVNQYLKNERIEKAKDLLENSDFNVTEITYKIGINSRSYFSKIFKDRYGVSPKKYADKIRNPKRIPNSA